MKKIISLILTLAIALSLCACGGSGDNGGSTEPQQAAGLQVGYARESILPNGQVNISGLGNQGTRISESNLDILYATCLAISENGTTILLFSTDTLTAKEEWTNEARMIINKATGVPMENIQIGGTHTHSGPAVGGDEDLVRKWKQIYMDALLYSAQDAIKDLAPATLYATKVQTEQMAFVRHFKMDDGTYAGSNFGDWTRTPVSQATKADEEMILIKIDREGEKKKDIMLMNFQAHPCFGYDISMTALTADYISVARNVFEQQTDMKFIYFLGSAGNQNTSSRISSENAPHNKDMTQYGTKLAQYAIDALPTMTTPVEGAGVKTTQMKYEYKCNDYGQDRLEDARLVNKMWNESGDIHSCNAYAKSLGFYSVYQCNGIVSCSNLPASMEMELNACSFGGIGFVAASYEMFSDSAKYIKENSPFEYTVISTCTNGYNNYYPTKEAFEYGCYESYTARFGPGVAEDAAEQFVQMLKTVQ